MQTSCNMAYYDIVSPSHHNIAFVFLPDLISIMMPWHATSYKRERGFNAEYILESTKDSLVNV